MESLSSLRVVPILPPSSPQEMLGPARKLHSPRLPGTRLLPVSSLQGGSGQRPEEVQRWKPEEEAGRQREVYNSTERTSQMKLPGHGQQAQLFGLPTLGLQGALTLFLLLLFLRILYPQEEGAGQPYAPCRHTAEVLGVPADSPDLDSLSLHGSALMGLGAIANHSQCPAAFPSSVLPAPGSSRAPCSLSHAWHAPYCTLSPLGRASGVTEQELASGVAVNLLPTAPALLHPDCVPPVLKAGLPRDGSGQRGPPFHLHYSSPVGVSFWTFPPSSWHTSSSVAPLHCWPTLSSFRRGHQAWPLGPPSGAMLGTLLWKKQEQTDVWSLTHHWPL